MKYTATVYAEITISVTTDKETADEVKEHIESNDTLVGEMLQTGHLEVSTITDENGKTSMYS